MGVGSSALASNEAKTGNVPSSGPRRTFRTSEAKDNTEEEAATMVEDTKFKVQTFRQLRKTVGRTKSRMESTLNRTLQRSQKREEHDSRTVLLDLVQLPPEESVHDWYAVNVIHFYNIASMVYGTASAMCTPTTCPEMNAGAKYQYLWQDEDAYPTPTPLCAKDYISRLFDWIEVRISDPSLFPTEENQAYSDEFMPCVRTIFKRLFRMYGHLYYSHFKQIRELGAEAHLHSSFQHFSFFILYHDIVPKEELQPLQKLIAKLVPDLSG